MDRLSNPISVSSEATTIDSRLHSSGPAASLNGLPDEMLLAVLSKFRAPDGGCDNKSLLVSSLVNHRLNFLATPLVYEEFNTRKGNPYLFLRTIAEAPALATHLRRLVWGYNAFPNGSRFHTPHDWAIGAPFPDTLIHAEKDAEGSTIATKLRTLGQPFATEIADIISTCKPEMINEALVSAILFLAPHVSSMDIGWWTLTRDRNLSWMNLLRFRLSAQFQQLHSISFLAAADPTFQLSLSALFGLQSLVKLEILCLVAVPGDTQHRTLAPRISNIEVLTIRDSHFESERAANMVLACRKLKSFIFEHSPGFRSSLDALMLTVNERPTLSLTALAPALEFHRSSLEHLAIIDADIVDGVKNPDPWKVAGNLDSLRDFPKLKSVWLPCWAFLQSQDTVAEATRLISSLPSGLHNLTLETIVVEDSALQEEIEDSHWASQVRHLLETVEHLTTLAVAVVYINTSSVIPGRTWYASRKVCFEKGVEFRVHDIDLLAPAIVRDENSAAAFVDAVEEWEANTG
ncbi:hypothetical protein K504DRAFT_448635 [Pleomassaria siparia CBS 279.74]|uniref:F-box domain-containing protein n=1 Tax=Pleomassaria siparia CBS 279.74 TaxID=1314801 RepID=A0A6G1JYM0_9PLEO|nr:hypothetical protein K504DRAFT_448635 [Pleomassaria siparia CBS 279.74]